MLCSECDLPILPDDEQVDLGDADDGSPYHGHRYHAECYDLRDGVLVDDPQYPELHKDGRF